MKEIIEAQKLWIKAKIRAQEICAERGLFELSDKISECKMFTGKESLSEMIALMFSAKGAEFLTTFRFPPIETFRQFVRYSPERLGVFIDKGKIALSQEKNIFVVGNTTAEIKCSETAVYHIIAMHGAVVNIKAEGYAVIKIDKDNFSTVNTSATKFAKILK